MTTRRPDRPQWRVALGMVASAALLASCASAAIPSEPTRAIPSVPAGASPSLTVEPATASSASLAPTAAPSASPASAEPASTDPFDLAWSVAAQPAAPAKFDWESLVEDPPVWTRIGDRTTMVIGYDAPPQAWNSTDGIHWTAAPFPPVTGGSTERPSPGVDRA